MSGRTVTASIRIATEAELRLLDEHLPTGSMPETHRNRFLLQQGGEGIYLVAWQDGLPIGHLFLHFQRPLEQASLLSAPDGAYVEALTTTVEKQRQGVARALMQRAEDDAKSRGMKSIGLSVGVDNAPAQALYRKLGYRSSGIPAYCVSWDYLDEKTGEIGREGELCDFWMKRLG